MSFRYVRLSWSVAEGTRAVDREAPFVLVTPKIAWGYGPLSEILHAPAAAMWIGVEIEPLEGTTGLALVTPNGGEILTQEAALRRESGRRSLFLRHTPEMGDARIVFRNYGEPGVPGAVRVLGVSLGTDGDLPSDAERLERQTPVWPDLTSEILASGADSGERLIPVSLGNSCETKFQIARVLHERRTGRRAGAAFRLDMLPPLRARDRFGWDLFDWRGTPLTALASLLEQDFAGAFEREDLSPHGKDVLNRRLGTTHLHEFEPVLAPGIDGFTEGDIDAGYENARSEFEALMRRFREHLLTPGPYLYVHVCEDVPPAWSLFNLLKLLSARSPLHRFRLLVVGYPDSDNDLSSLGPLVDKMFRPRTSAKPEPRSWEGDDAAWDAALAGYRLAFPDGSAAESTCSGAAA